MSENTLIAITVVVGALLLGWVGNCARQEKANSRYIGCVENVLIEDKLFCDVWR